ncbi:hypothetical protein SESBI_47873 [Sesbania bispinosa]|nr:hypothetical protein SESBI_47873 [Sesbania bispinosa]
MTVMVGGDELIFIACRHGICDYSYDGGGGGCHGVTDDGVGLTQSGFVISTMVLYMISMMVILCHNGGYEVIFITCRHHWDR